MDIRIALRGKKKVSASFDQFEVITDQPEVSGGDGSAPSPFDYFLASIGTCAGFFVQSFCQARHIPTDGIEIIQTMKASFPVVPAIPPIEKRTSGGTPAATQKAPFQLSARTIWPLSEPLTSVVDVIVYSSRRFPLADVFPPVVLMCRSCEAP